MEDANLKTHSPTDLLKKGFKPRLVTSLDNFLRRTLDICASLALDRQHLLLKARRLAAKGEIVISDRYPSETKGAMDSPRLLEDPNKSGVISDLVNWLARLEQQIYIQIPPPDIVLRLKVSIETAIKRNSERIKSGKETDVYVESRHHQNQDWCLSGTKYIYDINTEQLLAETILNVKKVIWESL